MSIVILRLTELFYRSISADMKDLITTSEAAKYVGVSQRTIYNMVSDGRLAAMNFGRFHLINKQDLIGLKPAKRGRKPKAQIVPQATDQARSMAA